MTTQPQPRKRSMKLTDLVTLTAPTPKSVKVFARPYWTAKIGSKVEATGNDAYTAIEALRKVIENAFDGSYTPHMLSFRGHLGIAWRTSEHWAYMIIDPDGIKKAEGVLTRLRANSLYDAEQETHKHLRSHMAQWIWDGQEEQSSLIEDEEDQQRFTSWTRWQKRYKELAATGMNDAAIRDQLMMERL